MRRPLFTVFTPTYNRRGTLGRVYHSLAAQTFVDFEWLIVDDGSTDGTAEQVRAWQNEASFPVRYLWQENQGKHVAHNRAVESAAGELFVPLDSDDACLPQALERFAFHWERIPAGARAGYSGISVRSLTAEAAVHPTERWGFHRTEVLRRYPFPVIPGERFLTEAVVWNRAAREFRVLEVEEPLRVYFASADGLQAAMRRLRMESPRGARLYYREALADGAGARHLVNYVRFSLHARTPLAEIVRDAGRPFLTLLALAPGAFCSYWDRRCSA